MSSHNPATKTVIPDNLPDDPNDSIVPARPEQEEDGERSSALQEWDLNWQLPGPEVVQNRQAGYHSTRFDLKRVVGKGGHGEVWEAEQKSLGRTLAVKVLSESIYADKSPHGLKQRKLLEQAFRQEAITTSQLEHPNIVPVHDLGKVQDGRPVLAMKMVKGRPWDELLGEEVEKSVQNRLSKHLPIFLSLCQAVAFAHSHGIIHRDIKPSQVMVGEFGEVMLMDWGLAVCFYLADEAEGSESASPNDTSPLKAVALSRAPNPAGTPSFMAPEQTDPTPDRLGPWTDVFLLAGVLYYLLTDTPPHAGTAPALVFSKAASHEVEAPEKRAPGRYIPEELSSLCMRAMVRDPHERKVTVEDIIEAVQQYQSGLDKQRKSMELTLEAKTLMELAPSSYRTHAACLSKITRARGLWPSNLEAISMTDRVLAAYSQTAIKNNDLVLARVQADRLRDGEERSKLLAEVEGVEKAKKRRVTQRYILLIIALMLVLLLFVTQSIAVNTQRETQAILQDAQRNESTAREAASQAAAVAAAEYQHVLIVQDALLDIIANFEDAIREAGTPINEPRLLEKIEHAIIIHQHEFGDQETRRRRIKALCNLAQMFHQIDENERATELLIRAKQMVEAEPAFGAIEPENRETSPWWKMYNDIDTQLEEIMATDE